LKKTDFLAWRFEAPVTVRLQAVNYGPGESSTAPFLFERSLTMAIIPRRFKVMMEKEPVDLTGELATEIGKLRFLSQIIRRDRTGDEVDLSCEEVNGFANLLEGITDEMQDLIDRIYGAAEIQPQKEVEAHGR
jgi:hypothetical protein